MTDQLSLVPPHPLYTLNPKLSDIVVDPIIGLDTETRGLKPWRDELRLIQLRTDNKTFLIQPAFYTKEELTAFFKRCVDSIIVAHGTKFDAGFIYCKYGVLFEKLYCTMLASQVYYGGSRKYRHGLADVLSRELHIHIGDRSEKKENQKSFAKRKQVEMTPEQLGYAAKDVEYLLPLREHFLAKIPTRGLEKIILLENKLTPVLIEMEARGCLIDVVGWKKQLVEWEAKRKEILTRLDAEVMRLYPMSLFAAVNYGSPKQVLGLFKDMKLPVPTKTERKGKEAVVKESVDEDTLQMYLNEQPETPMTKFIEILLEYREYDKLISTYGDSFLAQVDKNNYIHTTYSQCSTATHRLCIEENQKITVVGGEKAIKDIEIGDLVYCYDNEGKIRIRKVLNKWNKGKQPVFRLRWQSSGMGRVYNVGELICTKDHYIKTKYKNWQKASDLKRYDKLYHLTRRPYQAGGRERPRFYGTNGLMETEQTTIKREYFHAPSSYHIHHINGDTTNNIISNLKILTPSEHTSLHAKESVRLGLNKWRHLLLPENRPIRYSGDKNPTWQHVSKIWVLRQILLSGGRTTYADMDFNTFKKKCDYHGVDLMNANRKFNSKREHLNRGRVKKVSGLALTTAAKRLNIANPKMDKLFNYYGFTNHMVASFKPLNEERIVYDIEVEEFNNFIASEICVHNSSKDPNTQNIVSDKAGEGGKIRKYFIAPKGYKVVTCDMTGAEIALAADLSKDPLLVDNHVNGADMHSQLCSVSFSVMAGQPFAISKSKEPVTLNGMTFAPVDARDVHKSATFAKFYLGGADTVFGVLARYIVKMFPPQQRKDVAKRISDALDQKLSFLISALKKIVDEANSKGYIVATKLGRRRYFDGKVYGEAANSPCQGGCADAMKIALVNCRKYLNTIGGWLIMTVHDEVVCIVPTQHAEVAAKQIETIVADALTACLNDLKGKAVAHCNDYWDKGN